MMPSATKPLQASPGNPKNVHANPLSTAEAFQANGLLSSMEEETLVADGIILISPAQDS
jgi:hypothetical protein